MGSKIRPEKSKGELSNPRKITEGSKVRVPPKTRTGNLARPLRHPGGRLPPPATPATPATVAQAPHRAQAPPAQPRHRKQPRSAADLDKLRTKSAPAGRLDPASAPQPETAHRHFAQMVQMYFVRFSDLIHWYKCVIIST